MLTMDNAGTSGEHNKNNLNNVAIETLNVNAWEDELDRENNKSHDHLQRLETIMKRLQTSMAIFGIFNISEKRMKCCRTDTKEGLKRFLPSKYVVYNGLVLGLFWMNILRGIVAFFLVTDTTGVLVLRISITVWMFQAVMNATLMIKASRTNGGLCKVCRKWSNDVLPLIRELGVKIDTSSLRKTTTAWYVSGWVCIIINIIINCFMILYPNEPVPSLVIAPFQIHMYSQILACIFNTYMSVFWIIPMIYVMTMCTVIKFTLNLSRDAIQQKIECGRVTNTFPGCIYRNRLLHLNICKVIDKLDEDFGFFYANWLATNIPTACLIMYQLIKTEDLDNVELITFMFWLSANIISVALTTLAASEINKAAHSPLDCIHDIGAHGITLDQTTQLQLFLSKLTANQIGFTVINFVTITRELILTIAGLYITYIIILLQFK